MAPLLAPMSTVHAPNAMVASADGLATSAGASILARGGSAADAAVATNAVLAVTAPHMCGMGGDLFALVFHDGAVSALNASGRAGSGADPGRLRSEGHGLMPLRGDVRSVPVPGCVDGWLALHGRFGRLPLEDVLAPAAEYADNGFPASPLLVASLARLEGSPLPAEWVALATAALQPGARLSRPGAARTLRSVGAAGREAFYGGEFGAGLLALGGGEYVEADLDDPLADWVEPLSGDAWGHRLWTVPPNSQGYLILAASWIASQLYLPDDPDESAWPHLLVEATVQASHDRPAVLHEDADGRALVAPDRLASRHAAIREDAASQSMAPTGAGDTTYLCAVDSDGMGVSLIQSNASGFGSHLFEPSTGINLHNRGIGFSLEPGHPAEYGPGRRPPHTLAPAIVTRADGSLAAVLGSQGGDGQPHIVLQLLARLFQARQSPSRAILSPRFVLSGTERGFDTWTAEHGHTVAVEANAPPGWFSGLAQRGHPVASAPAFDSGFGHAQVIVAEERGMLAGMADPRARIGSAVGI